MLERLSQAFAIVISAVPIVIGCWLTAAMTILLFSQFLVPPVDLRSVFVSTGIGLAAVVPIIIEVPARARRFVRQAWSWWLIVLGMCTLEQSLFVSYDRVLSLWLTAGYFLGAYLMRPASERVTLRRGL